MFQKHPFGFLSIVRCGSAIALPTLVTFGVISFLPSTTPIAKAKGEECIFQSSVAGLNLVSLKISPSVIEGRRQPEGEVTLSAPAPTGGAVVLVGSNFYGANPGYCVIVPQGKTSQTFSIFTYRQSTTSRGNIFASYGDTFLEAELTVTP
ncbi:hypothetical protein Glo7428_4118 [Gloeocapsa sp. PCC 7428]|uniref:hypothetical protein n=1 Tax=Gloeocapsa sp. PCC 7428 TaxID=1173026 RepID=UPI0002A60735|nr:hypothetical protein [Gloeocapsa sp. PCC 7428]AFZ32567.1 hypothetical protein Glo7428_4118 [Gloeocapsa sp. PCC 7428]